MENFIYSINVTMPIFLVMVIGYILKQIGMLNDNFVTVANKFNFKVTLPFMLFKDIAGVDIKAICAFLCDREYHLFLGGMGYSKASGAGQNDPRGICTVVFPRKCGGYGAGFYPEYLRFLCNGTADDRQCSAAL